MRYDPDSGFPERWQIDAMENEGGVPIQSKQSIRLEYPTKRRAVRVDDPEEQSIYDCLVSGDYEWQAIERIARTTGLTQHRVHAILTKYYLRGAIVRHPKNDRLYGFWDRVRPGKTLPIVVITKNLEEYRFLCAMVAIRDKTEWTNNMTIRINSGLLLDRVNEFIEKFSRNNVITENPSFSGSWQVKNISPIKPGVDELSILSLDGLELIPEVPGSATIVAELIEMRNAIVELGTRVQESSRLSDDVSKIAYCVELLRKDFEIYVFPEAE